MDFNYSGVNYRSSKQKYLKGYTKDLKSAIENRIISTHRLDLAMRMSHE